MGFVFSLLLLPFSLSLKTGTHRYRQKQSLQRSVSAIPGWNGHLYWWASVPDTVWRRRIQRRWRRLEYWAALPVSCSLDSRKRDEDTTSRIAANPWFFWFFATFYLTFSSSCFIILTQTWRGELWQLLLKLIKEPVSHMHMRPSITGIKKSNSHVPSVYVSERLILQQKRLFLPVADPEKKKNPQIIRFQNAVLNPFVRQNTSTMAQHICLISWPMNLDLQLI